MPEYRKVVDEILLRLKTSAYGNNQVMSEMRNEEVPQEQSPRVHYRQEVIEELTALVSKQPPRAFQAFRLWEITKRFLDGQDVAMALNACLGEAFADDNVPTMRAPRRPDSREQRKRKKREFAETQKSFKKNQALCARRILDGRAQSAVDDPKVFLEEGRSIVERKESATIDLHVARPPETIDPQRLIWAAEIKAAFLPVNAASGPDGFTARRLKSVPMVVLRVFLNLLMLQKRLPLFLCKACTIFIPKKPGASTPSDHRPITISHVLVRRLQKVYFQRLLHEIHLDERQRVFIPVDGCAESIMLLATLIDEARRSHRPLVMASIDIAKAFDKVAHPAILRGLSRKGVSEDFVRYLGDFYTTSSTVLTYGERSLLAHLATGVWQGDPLSPLLFNLVIEEFLQELSPKLAFRSEGLEISAMAFADDLIVAASMEHGPQRTYSTTGDLPREEGLKSQCREVLLSSYPTTREGSQIKDLPRQEV
ncbi:hypothetical protein HPB49_001121 [Dermacentor silvarum]|uniref:Uncharacterized protein n=1 Tax=Dermacentor silvarum TaxID=543639 RepID=A0ACB8DHR6_DERSI|nr:hypothetical protein HPB49_001121 [Dermacentor silvarum]